MLQVSSCDPFCWEIVMKPHEHSLLCLLLHYVKAFVSKTLNVLGGRFLWCYAVQLCL